jgi:hypothetical protein
VHLDLYRLEQPAAAEELFALKRRRRPQALGAVLAVEWPGRLPLEPEGAWRVELQLLDPLRPDGGASRRCSGCRQMLLQRRNDAGSSAGGEGVIAPAGRDPPSATAGQARAWGSPLSQAAAMHLKAQPLVAVGVVEL